MKSFRFYITAFLCWVPLTAHAAVIQIPADTLNKWLTNGPSFSFLLIDVRDSSELAGSSIIATENCRPYNLSWNNKVLQNTLDKLPKNSAIVCYCKSGGRSLLAAKFLDSNGIAPVYSMNGGFSGWSGPTKSSSNVKPVSDLPAPSMQKAAAIGTAQSVEKSNSVQVHANNRSVYVEKTFSRQHDLLLIDLTGQCVYQEKNPFSYRTYVMLPSGLPPGAYVAELKTGTHGQTSLVRIAR